jgi:transposase-like protein
VAQHFLLSAAARSLSLPKVLRMSDRGAENVFARLRWQETNGKPVCPECGCFICYECPRPGDVTRFRCKGCRGDFSVTSGTLFASHKLPLKMYLAAIAVFCNEVKGKSMLAFSRDMGVQYKTAFVLCHKLREAMGTDVRAVQIGGAGKVAEVDGGYFGGYVKPANHKENRRDRRLAVNQNGKRQVVVVIRERDGRTLPGVFQSEGAAVPFIKRTIAPGTVVHADEGSDWNQLHGQFEMQRINHQQAYSADGACTNGAEGYFSRLRRAEVGHHHHISGVYLLRYAREAAWREDARRVDSGRQVDRIVELAMGMKPSVDFCGYWQRNRKAA